MAHINMHMYSMWGWGGVFLLMLKILRDLIVLWHHNSQLISYLESC